VSVILRKGTDYDQNVAQLKYFDAGLTKIRGGTPIAVTINSGLDIDKPVPSGSGNFYWATDTEKMYYDPVS
jgi:hypothetical protein